MKGIPEWVLLRRPKVYGAPLILHWSVFVVAGILALIAFANPLYGILFVASYLSIILVHEIGHAVVAHRLGYRVFSVNVTFWHGWCTVEAPETEWEHALIAWGGCLAQIAIAFPVLLVMMYLGERDWGLWTPVIVILGYLNIIIAVSNLLPGEESDGSVAWKVVPIFLQMRREDRARIAMRRSRRSRR